MIMSGRESGFVGERLTEAREARGINQTELARLLGIKRASISHYERSHRSPDGDIITRLCHVLGVPEAFFFTRSESTGGDTVFYRSLASATKTDRMRAVRRYGWLKRITSYLREFVRFPSVNLPVYSVTGRLSDLENYEVGVYAARTREFWGLGKGPISDVMLLLENNGVIVSKAVFGTRNMDAYSSFDAASATPYVIIAYDKNSAVRSRFDMAHELGHLVLHRELDHKVVGNPVYHKALESQANAFAAEFLMPSDSFAEDLGVISLDALKGMKRRWGVSVGAMLHRLSDLGWVSAEQSARFWMNYSRRGWRSGEPLDDEMEPESPRLLRRGFNLLVEKRVREPADTLSELCMAPDDVSELACLRPAFFSGLSRRDVEVVFRSGGGNVGATEEYGLHRHYTPQSLN